MAANLTIYCLENVTDYFEFERLCHDLMALEGYSSIEPLGGFKDKGRDAIHANKSGETAIFAYSVREDWRAKLAEDTTKIRKHGHVCDKLIFITTARISAGERDEAVAYIREDFGWALDLFSVERLRVLLDAAHPEVKESHPQIFPPDFLRLQSALRASAERNHLFISFSPEDGQFAEWLARRLTAEGYLVWCERFKSLGGESYPDDVDAAIRDGAFRVLAPYSRASLRNPEVMRQRTLALSVVHDRAGDFLIPLDLDGVTPDQLDRVTRSLSFIPFQRDWSSGLRRLLEKLDSVHCPKPLPDGRGVAASAFGERDVLTGQSESLYSNCLPIEKIPEAVLRFKTRQAVPADRLDSLQYEWAYRSIDPRRFLSFHHPPDSFSSEYRPELKGGESWSDAETIDGIYARDLVVELLRKSLVVKSHEKGLLYCPETFLHYFPEGLVERDRLYFTRPDGSRTFVTATGQRKFWKPTGSEEYKYHLAPVFSVSQGLFDGFVVLVRVRIRMTDLQGGVLPKRKGVSRRKHLCAGWWNNEWLNRMLAVSQHLADGTNIFIGTMPKEQIVIRASPLSLTASEGVNEEALDRLSFERSELLAALEDGDADDESGIGEATDD